MLAGNVLAEGLILGESLVALGALDQEGICSGTWLVGMGILDPTGSRIAVLRRLVVVEQSGGQRGNWETLLTAAGPQGEWSCSCCSSCSRLAKEAVHCMHG